MCNGAMIRVPIEVDITYVNKTWFSFKNPKKINQYVIGLFQRTDRDNSKIIAIPNNDPETIINVIFENVENGAMLYAEENILPDSLKNIYEVHEFMVNAGKKVNGDLHTNNVKNMWRDLKRNIKREYIHVSSQHLQSYCDEISWHINNRNLSPMEKFELALNNSVRTKKSTYKDLTKKMDGQLSPGIVPPASFV